VANFLAKTELLDACSPEQLVGLVQASQQKTCPAGELLLDIGSMESFLGIILQGRAAMFHDDKATGKKYGICKLSPGEFYGETGCLTGNPVALPLAAIQDCLVLEVPRNALAPLLELNPKIGIMIARQIATRMLNLSMLMDSEAMAPPPAPPAPALPDPAPAAPAIMPVEMEEGQIPWVDVADYTITPDLLDMLPTQMIQSHRVLPLELDGQILTVGMVNPRASTALSELRNVLQTVDFKVAAIGQDSFTNATARLKLDRDASGGAARGGAPAGALTFRVEQRREEEKKGQLIIGDEVIALFERILLDAVKLNASDIHIEPDSSAVRVRYRVSGHLIERDEFLADSYAAPLIARIKVLAELDITEHRKPQDGRISAQIGRRELNLRVSTMAVTRGEKAVIRIIDPEDVMRPLKKIFLHPAVGTQVASALSEPHGAIIVAGPACSGKSSTLYAMLSNRLLAQPDDNIATVEDPVEYQLPGITQASVNTRVGLDFATVLRGLLRLDPEVIMVGELRDQETAGIMVEAALTGNLVLTSTRGNDAKAVIQRLLYFGLDPVIFSQAVSCIIVQRLAGRLCPNCVEEREVAPALVESLIVRHVLSHGGPTMLPTPVGCQQCGGTGYIGRVAVQEVLRFDDHLRGLLTEGVSPEGLCQEGVKRGLFTSFSMAAAYLISRRVLAPSDALLITSGG